jgi:dynein heavy chain
VIEPPTLETASTILYRMLMWHLDARGFAKEFDAVIDQMISASMGIYRHLTGCPVMAAYPKRSGCRWNLRDLMRFTHGLLLSVPESIEDVGAMKRLWLHEACRVYSDRLTLLEPVALVTTYVEQSCETYFQATVSDLFAQMDMVELADLAYMNIYTIFFCDFSDPKSESRSYVEVMDMEHLTRVVNGYVTEYNNMNKRPMHYVNVFRHLMRTMAKASRVLKQPSGHLILVGPKGVGRHTLARLAGHASDSTVHQYESSCCSGENGPSKGGTWNYGDWVNALKLALIDSADDDKKCVFICSDVEFHRPECRALINHIVSHGDLMYLFDAKERNELVEQMRVIDLQKEKTLQVANITYILFKICTI